jgi:hypothetical protein
MGPVDGSDVSVIVGGRRERTARLCTGHRPSCPVVRRSTVGWHLAVVRTVVRTRGRAEGLACTPRVGYVAEAGFSSASRSSARRVRRSEHTVIKADGRYRCSGWSARTSAGHGTPTAFPATSNATSGTAPTPQLRSVVLGVDRTVLDERLLVVGVLAEDVGKVLGVVGRRVALRPGAGVVRCIAHAPHRRRACSTPSERRLPLGWMFAPSRSQAPSREGACGSVRRGPSARSEAVGDRPRPAAGVLLGDRMVA